MQQPHINPLKAAARALRDRHSVLAPGIPALLMLLAFCMGGFPAALLFVLVVVLPFVILLDTCMDAMVERYSILVFCAFQFVELDPASATLATQPAVPRAAA